MSVLLNQGPKLVATRLRTAGVYLSLLLIMVSFVGLFERGLNLGIDFTGGFITEFSTSEPVSQDAVESSLKSIIAGDFILTAADGQSQWTVRQADTKDGATSKSWMASLSEVPGFKAMGIEINLLDSDYIGTQVGEELINQGGLALLASLVMILMYLSVRFEWRFALGAILALFHDVVVVIGVFAWTQLEFNLTVLAGILAVVGYSLNDSIIVADRIREQIRRTDDEHLDAIVDTAIYSTLSRTLITSGTTLATVVAVWLLAGVTLEGFSVALFSGILVGTFSSFCVAATVPVFIGLNVSHYRQSDEQLNDELIEETVS